MSSKVFIIDDDPASLMSLEAICLESGFTPILHTSAVDALKKLKLPYKNDIALVISDFQMPEMNGLEFMKSLQEIDSNIPLILVTAFDSTQTAIDAMELGAFDYITKPINFRELSIVMNRAIKQKEIKDRFLQLQKKLKKLEKSSINFIGKSKSIIEINQMIKRVSTTNASVLISGETGTGKEIIAKLIHHNSQRKDKPFVAINCAAIPENLLESELFGHTRGAFTGADSDKLGLFLEANHGTIFLDEIGDMPHNLQTKILRVLQEGKLRRLGENKEHTLDIRVVSASHRNLVNMIKDEMFREDLFFRLNVINIKIPALRDRIEDIPLLAEFFLKKYSKVHNSLAKNISPQAIKELMNHHWSGNVRELENTIERACIMTNKNTIDTNELNLATVPKKQNNPSHLFDELPSLETLERLYIKHVLEHTEGVREKAAEILQINRKTLYRKIKTYELEKKQL